MLKNEIKHIIDNKQTEQEVQGKAPPTYDKEKGLFNQLSRSRIQFGQVWGYKELTEWVDKFYSDGVIEPKELSSMTKARGDILLDYQIAQNLISNMDKKSPQYAAAQRVMTHLYHCYMFISNAENKGKVYNSLTNEQKMRRATRSHQKEKINLMPDNPMEVALLVSLATTKSRMTAEQQAFHHEAMQTVNPRRKEELKIKVMNAIQYMQQEQVNAARLHQVLGLERA